jgi:5,10-methylenetetrahydromethanopterin reductase
MARLSAGVTLQGVDPPQEFIDRAKEIEQLGYDFLWVTDSSLHARYPYSYLTLAAVNTESIRIGTNCTHPFTRHPAVNLNACVTVNEISGGRMIIGVGAGDAPCVEVGHPIAKMRQLEEWIQFARRLLTGEKFSYEGTWFELNDGNIKHGLEAGVPEIWVVATGPMMLELAGRAADGVLVACGTFKEGLEWALGKIRKGAESVGRNFDDIDIGWHLFGVLDDDIENARQRGRSMAAWYIARSNKTYLADLAGVPPELAQEIRDNYITSGEFHEAKKSIELTPPEYSDIFVVAGGADVWMDRIQMGLDLGVKHVELFPMGDRYTLVRNFANQVMAINV